MRNLFDRRRAELALFTLVTVITAVTAACGVAPAVELATPVVLSPDTPIGVTGGLVQGALSQSNPDVIAFKDISLAAPPVGTLPWKPPTPLAAWDGVCDAAAVGNRCVQGGENATDLAVCSTRSKPADVPTTTNGRLLE